MFVVTNMLSLLYCNIRVKVRVQVKQQEQVYIKLKITPMIKNAEAGQKFYS